MFFSVFCERDKALSIIHIYPYINNLVCNYTPLIRVCYIYRYNYIYAVTVAFVNLN